MHLKIDSLLQGGKYRILDILGQGGFGITYLAEQTALGRRVAIKEFFMKDTCNRENDSSVSVPSVGSKELVESFRQKFLKEARVIASFSNAHIISVYDIFEENGTAYYVMEYLEGMNLTHLVPEGNKLDEAAALKYIRQVAKALEEVHSKNLLHLDVKPANIMLNGDGNAVLIDFGISKHYDESGSQTSSGLVGLSDGYAPMEQYKKGGISSFSPATDIYSLGATLYKLLTGKTPPHASDVNDDGLPPLPKEVSAPVRNAVTAAMQPRRKERPQSIAEFMALLDSGDKAAAGIAPEDEAAETVIVPAAVDARTNIAPEPSAAEAKVAPAAKQNRVAPAAKNNKNGGSGKIILLVFLLLEAGALVWFLLGNDGDNPKRSSSPEVVEPADVPVSEVVEPVEEYVSEIVEPAETVTLLNLTSTPSGATVYIDGKRIGNTPVKNHEVDMGEHTVKVVKDGFVDYVVTKEFGSDAVQLKGIVLKEKPKEKPKPVKIVETEAKQEVEDDYFVVEEEVEEEEIFMSVEDPASFPGGMQALMEYLAGNIKYPRISLENNSQGTTILRFVVNGDGSISDVEVMKSTGDMYLDNEAVRVVKGMPRWQPGVQNGRNVRCYFVLPVKFSLQ